jgi:predicted nucleic acid-binding protein
MLDTNIVSSLLNPDDALHACALSAVRRWEDQAGSFTISVIAWSELRVGAIRKGARAQEALAEFRAAVIDEVHPVTESISEAAAQLRATDLTIRVPDALIISTAREVGAGALLTADKKFQKIAPDVVELVGPA